MRNCSTVTRKTFPDIYFYFKVYPAAPRASVLLQPSPPLSVDPPNPVTQHARLLLVHLEGVGIGDPILERGLQEVKRNLYNCESSYVQCLYALKKYDIKQILVVNWFSRKFGITSHMSRSHVLCHLFFFIFFLLVFFLYSDKVEVEDLSSAGLPCLVY